MIIFIGLGDDSELNKHQIRKYALYQPRQIRWAVNGPLPFIWSFLPQYDLAQRGHRLHTATSGKWYVWKGRISWGQAIFLRRRELRTRPHLWKMSGSGMSKLEVTYQNCPTQCIYPQCISTIYPKVVDSLRYCDLKSTRGFWTSILFEFSRITRYDDHGICLLDRTCRGPMHIGPKVRS